MATVSLRTMAAVVFLAVCPAAASAQDTAPSPALCTPNDCKSECFNDILCLDFCGDNACRGTCGDTYKKVIKACEDRCVGKPVCPKPQPDQPH